METKFLLFSLLIFFSTIVYAQSWQTSTNMIYSSPTSTTNVGVGTNAAETRLHVDNGALKIGSSTSSTARTQNLLLFGDDEYVALGEFQNDDMLSFRANSFNFTDGYVGIGTSSPQYELDVNGSLFLHTVADSAQWYRSYLYYGGHSLIVGSPVGYHRHNSLDLVPGGAIGYSDTLSSQIRLYCSPSTSTHIEKIHINTQGHCWFKNSGNIGIGTSSPQYKLDVNGTIRAKQIIVNLGAGADFVFSEDYKLPKLNEVEEYVKEHKHLPDIQSESEMVEEGVDLNSLTIQLLQKIEELTLYTIEQEKRIAEQEMRIKQLEKLNK